MTLYCNTQAEADALAKELRTHYKDTDWKVSVTAPLFPGDRYMVAVG